MAKKIIETIETKAPVIKQSAEQKKAIRDALKNVVDKSINATPAPVIENPSTIVDEPTPTPVIEQTPTPADNEIKIEPLESDGAKVDKVDEAIDATHKVIETPEVKKGLSLFNTFKQKTEEDDNKNTVESVTENLLATQFKSKRRS